MQKQWEKRLDIIKFIYSCLINEIPLDEYIHFSFDQGYDFDANALQVIEYIMLNSQSMIEQIKPLLSQTWSWERINKIQQAILLQTIAESKTLNTPKKILIDQALITGRNYDIDDSYKFMNPILDKLISENE